MRKIISITLLISLLFLINCKSLFEKKEANCVIVGEITVTEDYEGDIKFLGEIKNIGNAKACFVKITFTMKNAQGNVIGTDFTFVNSVDLAPGQTSSFECYTEVLRAQVATWSYEITWQECD
jgi:hypothetical protein